jgi:hypothetical protein
VRSCRFPRGVARGTQAKLQRLVTESPGNSGGALWAWRSIGGKQLSKIFVVHLTTHKRRGQAFLCPADWDTSPSTLAAFSQCAFPTLPPQPCVHAHLMPTGDRGSPFQLAHTLPSASMAELIISLTSSAENFSPYVVIRRCSSSCNRLQDVTQCHGRGSARTRGRGAEQRAAAHAAFSRTRPQSPARADRMREARDTCSR